MKIMWRKSKSNYRDLSISSVDSHDQKCYHVKIWLQNPRRDLSLSVFWFANPISRPPKQSLWLSYGREMACGCRLAMVCCNETEKEPIFFGLPDLRHTDITWSIHFSKANTVLLHRLRAVFLTMCIPKVTLSVHVSHE